MKTQFILAALITCSLFATAQTRDEIVVGRAREFHRVFTQKDKDQWRKFIKENYTKAFIERPMRVQVSDDDGTKSATPENAVTDPVEAKLKMFERLNTDLPNARIGSVSTKGEDVEMVVNTGNQLIGTFRFRFDKNAPYLIDGIGIEVGDR